MPGRWRRRRAGPSRRVESHLGAEEYGGKVNGPLPGAREVRPPPLTEFSPLRRPAPGRWRRGRADLFRPVESHLGVELYHESIDGTLPGGPKTPRHQRNFHPFHAVPPDGGEGAPRTCFGRSSPTLGREDTEEGLTTCCRRGKIWRPGRRRPAGRGAGNERCGAHSPPPPRPAFACAAARRRSGPAGIRASAGARRPVAASALAKRGTGFGDTEDGQLAPPLPSVSSPALPDSHTALPEPVRAWRARPHPDLRGHLPAPMREMRPC